LLTFPRFCNAPLSPRALLSFQEKRKNFFYLLLPAFVGNRAFFKLPSLLDGSRKTVKSDNNYSFCLKGT
ncbi:MAG: hypothetical protein J6W67_02360, partial [Lentisphaeria bacterium]|nr:hypothetical protein [Lentisphaeria bacterium]